MRQGDLASGKENLYKKKRRQVAPKWHQTPSTRRYLHSDEMADFTVWELLTRITMARLKALAEQAASDGFWTPQPQDVEGVGQVGALRTVPAGLAQKRRPSRSARGPSLRRGAQTIEPVAMDSAQGRTTTTFDHTPAPVTEPPRVCNGAHDEQRLHLKSI